MGVTPLTFLVGFSLALHFHFDPSFVPQVPWMRIHFDRSPSSSGGGHNRLLSWWGSRRFLTLPLMIEDVESTPSSTLLHLMVFQFPMRATWSLMPVRVPIPSEDPTWLLMLVGIHIFGEDPTWSLTVVVILIPD